MITDIKLFENINEKINFRQLTHIKYYLTVYSELFIDSKIDV